MSRPCLLMILPNQQQGFGFMAFLLPALSSRARMPLGMYGAGMVSLKAGPSLPNNVWDNREVAKKRQNW